MTPANWMLHQICGSIGSDLFLTNLQLHNCAVHARFPTAQWPEEKLKALQETGWESPEIQWSCESLRFTKVVLISQQKLHFESWITVDHAIFGASVPSRFSCFMAQDLGYEPKDEDSEVVWVLSASIWRYLDQCHGWEVKFFFFLLSSFFIMLINYFFFY